MKTIAAAFIITALFAACFAQKKVTDAELKYLKGKVKSIVTETTEIPAANDKTTVDTGQPKFVDETEYDKNGVITENLNYLTGTTRREKSSNSLHIQKKTA